MPASSTEIQMRLTGVDNASALLDAATAKLAKMQGASAKASHKLRDAALGAGKALLFTGPLAALRTLRRGLLATAGAAAALAYATDRSAARLGELSDAAAQAGASADEIQRLSTALGEAGVRGASVDTISNALARMAKTTGRTGLAGLRETLAEIAALPDEAARIVALSDTFGKALGPQFAALVRQGPDAFLKSLDAAVAAMPRLSEEAVKAGDDVADGMKTIRTSISNGWDSLLVSIAEKIAKHLGADSFRELGLRVGAYVSYYAEIAIANIGPLWDHLKFWATNLPRIFGAAFEDIGNAIHEHLSRGLDALGRFLPALRIYTRAFGAAGNISAGDWEGAWDTIVNGNKPREAGSALGRVMAEFAGREFVRTTEAAEAHLAEALENVKPGAKAIEEMASGIADEISDAEGAAADLGKAGAAAAKKTAEAWRGADAVIGGSYEALKIAFRNRENQQTPRLAVSDDLAAPFADAQRAADSLAASASASAETATSSWGKFGEAVVGIFDRIEADAKRAGEAARATLSSASSAPTSPSASPTELPQLLQVQRDGWAFLRSSLGSLGVV